jgi:hypothetical protein
VSDKPARAAPLVDGDGVVAVVAVVDGDVVDGDVDSDVDGDGAVVVTVVVDGGGAASRV